MAEPHRLSPSGKFLEPGGGVQMEIVQTSDGPIPDTPPFTAFDGSQILVTNLEEGEKLIFRWCGSWIAGGGGGFGALEVAIGTWDGAIFTPLQQFAPFFGYQIGLNEQVSLTCECFRDVGTASPFPFQLPPGTYTFAVGLLEQSAVGCEVRIATFSVTRIPAA